MKGRRLQEIIDTQREASRKRLSTYVGRTHDVLIEGVSKRSAEHMYGRSSQNSIVIIPRKHNGQELKPGMFVRVAIHDSTAGSLKGELVGPIEEALLNA